jgi:hypothetical protein
VWPYAKEKSRSSHDDVPAAHLRVMAAFLRGFSGICNFNYKVRQPDQTLAIFEINPRVGADLSMDVPRPRARQLFEKLDELRTGPRLR